MIHKIFTRLILPAALAVVIIALFGMVSGVLHAQTVQGSIKGIVVERRNDVPIEAVDVILYKQSDSSMVKGTQTDPNGSFTLSGIGAGTYYIKANLVGYNAAIVSGISITDAKKDITLNPVKLGQGETTTEEIVVEGEKSMFEFRPDKKVFNVAKDITSQGGTLIDLLRNVPSVTVDQDGNVSLRGGEGVKIMIDGRTSGLEGQNRNAILEQIAATQVESIELITNPSAKFEAEGSVGVINIVLKKNESIGTGYNGTLGLNMGTGDKYSGQLSLSMRNDKFNVYGNYGYNLRNMKMTGSSDLIYLNNPYLSEVTRDNSGRGRNKSHNIKLGIDFFPDKMNTIGLSFNYRNQQGTRGGTDFTKEYDVNGATITDYFSTSNDEDKGYSFDVNANYTMRFKTPQQVLTAELSYSRDKDDETEDNYYTYIMPSVPDPFRQMEFSDEQRDGFNGKMDYTHPFSKDIKLETGLNTKYSKRDNDFTVDTFDYSQNQYITDINRSNRFIYKEFINAGYGILTHQLGTFGYSLGLRAEYTKINGELVTTSQLFDKDYIDFFPSASISQKLGSASEIQLSYARRINRPRQRQLNPFMTMMGSNNYSQGNPDLNPEFTDAMELSFIQYLPFATITPSVFFRQTKDEITRQRSLLDSVNTLTTFVNLNKSRSYGGELIVSSSPAKFINFNGTFSFYRNELDASNISGASSRSANIWSVRGVSNIIMPADMSMQLSYFYSGERVTPNGTISPMQSFDAAIKKDFFDKTLSVTLRATDIFNTAKFKYNFDDGTFIETSERFRDSRGLFLNISYKFGKEDRQKERRRRNENENNNEDYIDY